MAWRFMAAGDADLGSTVVGAVAHEWHETHLQLEEIYLEPTAQNQGIGTEVLRGFMAQAWRRQRPIRLHVLASNPARRFYERLGFQITRSAPGVVYLEYTPPPAAGTGPDGPPPTASGGWG